MLKEFCLVNLKVGDHVEDLGIDRMIMLKLFVRKENEGTFNGLQSALNRCTTRPLTESDDTR
jgi:hypothetical protein